MANKKALYLSMTGKHPTCFGGGESQRTEVPLRVHSGTADARDRDCHLVLNNDEALELAEILLNAVPARLILPKLDDLRKIVAAVSCLENAPEPQQGSKTL